MIQYRASIAVVDVFAEIVAKVNTIYTESTVAFLHGHPNEVHQTLVDLSTVTSGVKRYPFICLLQDFTETYGGDYTELKDLHLLIANLTDQNYTAAQRYTHNFKPVLYPIYDLLKYSIVENTNIVGSDAEAIPHEKTDRLMWGKSGVYGSQGEIFTDKIDAIEITKLQLKLKKANCLIKL